MLTSLNFALACMHRKQGNYAGTYLAALAVSHLTRFNMRKKVPHTATIKKSAVWTTLAGRTMVKKVKVKLDGLLSFGSFG